MFATVDKSCIGCGSCAEVCSKVFRMTDDDLAEAYTNPVPLDLETSASEAAKLCPVGAIIIE